MDNKKDTVLVENVVSSWYMSMVMLPTVPAESTNARAMIYTLANMYGVDLKNINNKVLKKQVTKHINLLKEDKLAMLRIQSTVTGLVSDVSALVYTFKTDKNSFDLLKLTECIANTLLVIWIIERLSKG